MAIEEAICRRRTNLTSDVDFTSVVEQFHSPLFRFAVYLLRSESDAADLVQQTFLKLAENSHQIRDFSQIKCWLFTTLRREFLRTVRRRKKRPETEFIPDVHDPPTREPEPWRSLDTRIVLDALLQIDAKYRTPVELFYLSELSYKEIAETLQIPIGTVMRGCREAKNNSNRSWPNTSIDNRPGTASNVEQASSLYPIKEAWPPKCNHFRSASTKRPTMMYSFFPKE